MGFLKQVLGLQGASQTGNSTSTGSSVSKTTLDPAIQSLIFGSNGSQGLLSQYQGLLNQPQSDASKAWAGANADYLTQYGGGDLNSIRNSAQGLMTGNSAPMTTAAQGVAAQGAAAQGAASLLGPAAQMSAPTVPAAQTSAAMTGNASATVPSYAVGNMIDAPGQNNIDLTSTFQGLLGGGNTSALMNSLQAGNALTSAQFKQNQQDLTDNFQRNVLGSIRGGAIGAGQYGSSRQGIAEGLAASDLTKQLNNSNTQLGLANSANTASALSNAYENGQNRSLSAAQGLSGQQYSTAAQNAATKNQAEFMNVGNQLDISKYNAGLAQQSMLANQAANNAANTTNAGLQQQNNLAYQQAQMQAGANNQAATNQFALANQQAQNQFGLANLGYQNQSSQSNLGYQNQFGLANLGYQNQANLANQQAQLTTNGQNNSAVLGGAGLLGGLLSSAGNNVGAQDNYNLTRAQQVNGLLAPYLNANSTTTTNTTGTTPIYENRGQGFVSSVGNLLSLFG